MGKEMGLVLIFVLETNGLSLVVQPHLMILEFVSNIFGVGPLLSCIELMVGTNSCKLGLP